MIETISVRPDDTIPVLQQRLAAIHGGRVALVLEDGAHQLAHTVRLDLLIRQAQRQGVELALVTRHMPTQGVGQTSGLPVFNRLEQATAARTWPQPPTRLATPARDETVMPPVRTAKHWFARRQRPGAARARNRQIAAISARRDGPAWWHAVRLLLLLALLGGAVVGALLLTVPVGTVIVIPSQQSVIASINVRALSLIHISETTRPY